MAKTKIEDDGCVDSNLYWLESDFLPAWMTEKLSRQEEKTDAWYKAKAKEIDAKLRLIEENKK